MYIGLDVGTSSVKAVVFSENGTQLASAAAAYQILGTGPDLELDPEEVRDAAYTVLQKVSCAGYEIRSIGISSLGEAAVLLDGDGKVIRNSILPGDPRGSDEAAQIPKRDLLTRRTGLPINGTYTMFKLLWLQKHCPEQFAQIRRVMLYGDYIGWCLTNEAAISFSLASRACAFDLEQRKFFPPFSGIDPDWFSTPVRADAMIGRVTREAADQTGIGAGTPVFAGGHDQPCAAVGAGAVDTGAAADSIGTSECLTIHLGSQRLRSDQITKTNYACQPFMEDHRYDTMAYTHTAGRMVEWYLQQVLHMSQPNANRILAGRCTKGPSGLLVLPHLSGSGTPTMDPCSVGAVIGLNLHTDEAAIYQGILEGISYEMKLNLKRLEELGVRCSRIVAVGGGAHSDIWLQIKANIYQLPIETTVHSDASALGAAIAAAVGQGDFTSISEASRQLARTGRIFYPQETQVRRYEAVYQQYESLYQAIKQIRQEV